jgi:hypothetical protein
VIRPRVRDDADGRTHHLEFSQGLILRLQGHAFDDGDFRPEGQHAGHDPHLLDDIGLIEAIEREFPAIGVGKRRRRPGRLDTDTVTARPQTSADQA